MAVHVAVSFTILQLIATILWQPSSAQRTYYIKPYSNTSCETTCLTITDFALTVDQRLTPDTTLLLLPGNHSLDTDLNVTDVSRFVMQGVNASLSLTRVICTKPVSIRFDHAVEVLLSGLAISSCGASIPGIGALHAYSVVRFNLSSVSVDNSLGSSGLVAYNVSELTITECSFVDNRACGSGGGLHVDSSSLSITDTQFIGNTALEGGGIYTRDTLIVANGSISLLNNSARGRGGGISSVSSSIACSGSLTFLGNYAVEGGGVFVEYGNITLNGSNTFVSNKIQNPNGEFSDFIGGGGISTNHSNLTFVGDTLFADNIAMSYGGGGIASNQSLLSFTGFTEFVRNEAFGYRNYSSTGGGIAGYSSQLVSYGCLEFMNNSAYSGGGLGFFQSNLTIFGISTFTGNTAIYAGGAIDIFRCNMNASGETQFFDNTARQFGGALSASSIDNKVFTTLFGTIDDRLFRNFVSLNGTTRFARNSGADNGGAVYILGTRLYSFGTTTFVNNIASRIGGAVYMIQAELTLDGRKTFVNNSANFSGGAVYLHSAQFTAANTTTYMNNRAPIGAGMTVYNGLTSFVDETHFIGNNGSALFASHSALTFKGNTNFAQNVQGSAILIVECDIRFDGSTIFSHNIAKQGAGLQALKTQVLFVGYIDIFNNSVSNDGGGIYAAGSTINVDEANVTFENNSAELGGGGLAFAYNSHISLDPPSEVKFTGNNAKLGGAIFIDDNVTSLACSIASDTSELVTFGHCFFELLEVPDNSEELSPESENKALFAFKDNVARTAGHVLYGGLLDRCKFSYESTSLDSSNNLTSLAEFIRISSISSNDNNSVISSDALQVCFCSDGHSIVCNKSSISVSVIRGVKFSVTVTGVDQTETNSVFATIRSRLPTATGKNARLGDGNDIQNTTGSCTALYYQVYSSDPSEELTIYPEGPCENEGISPRTIHVIFIDCPPGFDRYDNGSECVCDRTLTEFHATCDVNDNSVTKDDLDFWVGPTSSICETYNTSKLTYHRYCPFDYCQPSARIQLDNLDSQCSFSRTGTLCGGCPDGFSLVFGSSQCKRCSNSYIGFLLLYALAGIALVLFLLLCQMTVATGMLGGLLFYANIIAVNRTIFFPNQGASTLLLRVFIAWLNLDVGFEVCFYNGMDAYARTWLQFVFPLYIWGIVGAVTVLSHYSQWVSKWLGSNPVAVLATLFLLSYSKLLRTIIAAFGVDTLDCPGEEVAVWVMDGNVRYFKGKHTPLFLVALLVLVLVFFPYTFLLLFGQWLQKWSKWRLLSWPWAKIKPFLDAYQAPYKLQHRYWIGFLLLVRCVLFLVFEESSDDVNLLAIACTSAGLLTLNTLTGGVYKNWILQALESAFLLNLTILSAGTYHVLRSDGNQVALVSTSVGVALLTFVGIVIYHILVQLRGTKVLDKVTKIIKSSRAVNFVSTFSHSENEPSKDFESSIVELPTTTWVGLREPLLEDTPIS